MNWLRKTGMALALQSALACLLLVWQIVAPAASVLPSQEALAADAGARTLNLILINSFNMDVAASVGGTTYPLGNVANLQNFVVLKDQPLPSVAVNKTVPVAGTTATYTATLAVVSYDPFVLSLKNFTVTLATGESASLPDLSQAIPLPINSPFSVNVPTQVSGIGTATFIFTGTINAVKLGS